MRPPDRGRYSVVNCPPISPKRTASIARKSFVSSSGSPESSAILEHRLRHSLLRVGQAQHADARSSWAPWVETWRAPDGPASRTSPRHTTGHASLQTRRRVWRARDLALLPPGLDVQQASPSRRTEITGTPRAARTAARDRTVTVLPEPVRAGDQAMRWRVRQEHKLALAFFATSGA